MFTRPLVGIIDDCETDMSLLTCSLIAHGYEPVDLNLVWQLPFSMTALIIDWELPPKMIQVRDMLLAQADEMGIPVCYYSGHHPKQINDPGRLVISKAGGFSSVLDWLSGAATTHATTHSTPNLKK